MVNNISAMKSFEEKDFDIFRAAENDDIVELKNALSEGQSLNAIQNGSGFTPLHIAIIKESTNFLSFALQQEFDPWIRDYNERLAIDHAAAWGMKDVQVILLEKMYPTKLPPANIIDFKP